MQIEKRGAQQAHLRGGMPEVNVARTLRRISTSQYELPCQRKRVLVGALKHERTCICEYCGVKAGGNHGRNHNSGFACQLVNHFRGGDSLRVNPIDVCKPPPTQMV